MDENQLTETTPATTNVVLINEPPTTKQQLITAAIGLGSAIAVPVILVAGLSVVNGGASLVKRVRGRKAKSQEPLTNEDATSTEE